MFLLNGSNWRSLNCEQLMWKVYSENCAIDYSLYNILHNLSAKTKILLLQGYSPLRHLWHMNRMRYECLIDTGPSSGIGGSRPSTLPGAAATVNRKAAALALEMRIPL